MFDPTGSGHQPASRTALSKRLHHPARRRTLSVYAMETAEINGSHFQVEIKRRGGYRLPLQHGDNGYPVAPSFFCTLLNIRCRARSMKALAQLRNDLPQIVRILLDNPARLVQL